MLGTVRTILKALQMPGIIAPLPAVEGLRADAKIAAGESGIVSIRVVVIKPFKSLPGFFSIAPEALPGERLQELLHLLFS